MLQTLAQYSSRGSNSAANSVQQAAPVLFAGVFLIFILFFALAMVALLIFVFGRICQKAGYSFWLALLLLVPLGNIGLLLIFAFSKWPLEHEVEMLRARVGYGGTGPRTGGFPVGPPPAR